MTSLRKVGIAGLFSFLFLGLAACGSSSTDTAADDTSVDTAVAVADFPVTVGDLTLDVRPERIVSLSPTATEMLFAVGAGDQVIAVDNYSNFPTEAAELEQVDSFEPNVEAIAGLEPDLVIATYDPGNLVEQLNALDIAVFFAGAVADLDGAYEQLEQIGALTGNLAAAQDLTASMRSDIDAIVAAVGGSGSDLSYYYELDPTLYSVTSNTFVGGVMALFGLTNIADGVESGNDYPQLSAEVIVIKDPDIIMLADTLCCEQSAVTVAARDGWAQLTAVRNGNVIELNDDIASRWGPRLVDLVRTVGDAVTAATGS
ncbi:MAG: ABC transporter substrate-binding protein [Ilumatobacteraceae bacterium]